MTRGNSIEYDLFCSLLSLSVELWQPSLINGLLDIAFKFGCGMALLINSMQNSIFKVCEKNDFKVAVHYCTKIMNLAEKRGLYPKQNFKLSSHKYAANIWFGLSKFEIATILYALFDTMRETESLCSIVECQLYIEVIV